MGRVFKPIGKGFVFLVVLLVFSCGEPENPAPSVISLMDQLAPGEDAEPFRIIFTESRPAAFLLGSSGLSMRLGTREFTSDDDSLVLYKIMKEDLVTGLITQTSRISTIHAKCSIRPNEKLILRLQYRKPNADSYTASCQFITNSRKSDSMALIRTGNHVEANLDAPPEGAKGIVIRHDGKIGDVLDLTSIILIGLQPPIGRSERYRIRAFFDRYSGSGAIKASVDSDNPRISLARDGEIRDCIRLKQGSDIAFALPEDMPKRALRFHVLPLSGRRIYEGEITISFTGPETREILGREFPQGVSEENGFDCIIESDRIPEGSDSVRITLKNHRKGILIAEPVAVLSQGQSQSNPLNLVLIDLDTVRADRLGTYGYTERPTTVRLDSLLDKRGFFVFDRAFSPSPWTLPATAKIFASRYLDFHTGSSVPPEYTLLAEMLRWSGYYCAGFTGGGQLALPGFEQGFHEYHYSEELGKVEDSFPQAEAWIESWNGGSFFLFLHTYEPHWPYTRDIFCSGLRRGRLRNIGAGGRPFPQGVDICTKLSREESLFVQAAYDSGIRRATDAVVDFLALLKRKKLWENTVVIVLSDHGEEFWEHFPVFASHAHSLYDELLRVPLMMYVPNRSERGISHIAGSVNTVDVVPTIYDLLGVPTDSMAVPIDGISLVGYLDNPAADIRGPMLAAVKSPGLPKICIVADGKKLIEPFGSGIHRIEECRYYPPKIELYDLVEDPDERFDLSEKDPLLRKSLRKRLDRVRKEAVQPMQNVSTSVDGPSEELKTQLKRLGYLE